MEKLCKNCEWWKRWGPHREVGICRLDPPVFIGLNFDLNSMWENPDVEGDDVCSHFTPKEPPVGS